MEAKRADSRSSRISSIPRLEAASISIRSTDLPSSISLQESQLPQASYPPSLKLRRMLNLSPPEDWPDKLAQLTAFASNLARVVLPLPRGPERGTQRSHCPPLKPLPVYATPGRSL